MAAESRARGRSTRKDIGAGELAALAVCTNVVRRTAGRRRPRAAERAYLDAVRWWLHVQADAAAAASGRRLMEPPNRRRTVQRGEPTEKQAPESPAVLPRHSTDDTFCEQPAALEASSGTSAFIAACQWPSTRIRRLVCFRIRDAGGVRRDTLAPADSLRRTPPTHRRVRSARQR